MPAGTLSIGVVEELIAKDRINRPGNKMTPTTITIHNTDNTSPGAGAKAHSRFVRNTGYYMLNGKKHPVSWHFSVDDSYAIQHLPLDEVAFHAGTTANGSSLAIEICMNPDSDEARANSKAAALAAHLLRRYGLGIGALRRHNDWNPAKQCPRRLMAPSKWSAFVAEVNGALADAAADAADSFAEEPIYAPAEVESFEIDHDAVAAAILADGPGGADVADRASGLGRTLADIASVLTTSTSARALFPNGITRIALTLPGGVSLTVEGPAGGAPADGFSDAADAADSADDEDLCEAPDDGAADAADTTASPINVHLGASGLGFYTYGPSHKRFGTAQTIAAIKAIADTYFDETGLRIGVGNISVDGGGSVPPHKDHKRGLDVDFRPLRKDGLAEPTTVTASSYSRGRTRRLVEIIRSNPVLGVRTILFNDAAVPGVSPASGHHNHLHVGFTASSAAGDGAADALVEPNREGQPPG